MLSFNFLHPKSKMAPHKVFFRSTMGHSSLLVVLTQSFESSMALANILVLLSKNIGRVQPLSTIFTDSIQVQATIFSPLIYYNSLLMCFSTFAPGPSKPKNDPLKCKTALMLPLFKALQCIPTLVKINDKFLTMASKSP